MIFHIFIYICLSQFDNKSGSHRARFELSALKDKTKGIFSRLHHCYAKLFYKKNHRNLFINHLAFVRYRYCSIGCQTVEVFILQSIAIRKVLESVIIVSISLVSSYSSTKDLKLSSRAFPSCDQELNLSLASF